jgi:hypothetical protein
MKADAKTEAAVMSVLNKFPASSQTEGESFPA